MELNKNSKVVYWCKTKELAKEFLKECEQNIPLDSEIKDAAIINWEELRKNTCYRIKNNEIFFDSKKWYTDNGYTIIEYTGKDSENVFKNDDDNDDMKTGKEQIEHNYEAEYWERLYIDKATQYQELIKSDVAMIKKLREENKKLANGFKEFTDKVLLAIKYEYENYPDAMTCGTYHQLRKEINKIAVEYGVEVKE